MGSLNLNILRRSYTYQGRKVTTHNKHNTTTVSYTYINFLPFYLPVQKLRLPSTARAKRPTAKRAPAFSCNDARRCTHFSRSNRCTKPIASSCVNRNADSTNNPWCVVRRPEAILVALRICCHNLAFVGWTRPIGLSAVN